MRPILRASVVALVFVATVCAQQAKPEPSTLPEILHRMENASLAKRDAAFDELMTMASEDEANGERFAGTSSLNGFLVRHPDHADQIKLALINLLIRENYLFIEDKNPPSYDEWDTDHYAQLIDVVAELDDDRAIPALVGAMTAGAMASGALLKYGDKALKSVLGQLKNQNELVRAEALELSIKLLGKRNDPISRARIRELIRSSLTDPGSTVRSSAVQAIECLGDRNDFLPTLEKIAKTDPVHFRGRADDGVDGDQFYPVRFEARRVLQDIRENSVCAH